MLEAIIRVNERQKHKQGLVTRIVTDAGDTVRRVDVEFGHDEFEDADYLNIFVYELKMKIKDKKGE